MGSDNFVVNGYDCFRFRPILEEEMLGLLSSSPYTQKEIEEAREHGAKCDACDDYMERVAERGSELIDKRMERVIAGPAGLDKRVIILKLRA